MADGRHLKMKKLASLKGVTNCHEIWYDDTN